MVTAVLFALGNGAVGIDLGAAFKGELTFVQNEVLANIRAPRVLLAVFTGAILGIAGAALQGLFRNPLADPGLIGVSSGAALGAIAMIVIGEQLDLPEAIRPYALPIAAIFGAFIVTSLLVMLASHKRTSSMTHILLVGIAINAIAGVGIGIFQYLSDDGQLRTLTFWMMGSLGRSTWATLTPTIILILISSAMLFQSSRALDILQLGEPQAQYMGIEVARLKKRIILSTAIGVGAAVSITGLIGFVGLVVPHIARLLISVRHKPLLIGSGLIGAAILTSSDLAARLLMAPAEIPISIITSAVGAPFFLWLVVRMRNQ
jgi:iron complex transport system permease protein